MLKGRIDNETELTVWAEFSPGFEVEIRYVPRDKLRRIFEQAKTQGWNHKTHQLEQRTDDQKLYRAIAEIMIKDWRGLNADVLRELLPMKEYPEREVPYSVEDATELLLNAYGFDQWVQQLSAELGVFRASRREEEAKNLSPSPGGS